MPTREELYRIIRSTVIHSISGYIARHNRNPNFQILDLIIPTERRIRSVVGGMETSMGTTLWEPLAKAIAVQNGFEVIDEDLQCPANMPEILQNTLRTLVQERNNGNPRNTAVFCHDSIRDVCQNFRINPIRDFIRAPKGFGVDIWLRKDNINYFFDTKTVQSNLGSYSKYFSQLLNWYGYFYSRYPTQNASARIVFPYNPYGINNFWQKTIGNGGPLEPGNEGWVENEFWDFCSGVENTYSIIHNAFTEISENGDLNDTLQHFFYGSQ